MSGVLLQIIGGIVCLIVAYIGTGVASGGVRLGLRQRRIDARGVDGTGTVIRHREQGDNRFFSYQFSVGAKTYIHEEAAEGDPPPIGSSVPIRYLPDAPKYNGMAGDTPYARIYRGVNVPVMSAVTAAFVGLAALGVWLILSASGG
jgi:hypothetical protein